MKRIDVDPYTHLLIVKFRFLNKHWKEEMQTKRNILSLQKRVYSRGLNVWMVPPTGFNIEKLWEWRFSFPEDFSELVGHDTLIKKVVKELENCLSPKHKITVAIMGCEVNGPGEAKEADIGIAFGKNSGILFKKGKIIKKINAKRAVKELLNSL